MIFKYMFTCFIIVQILLPFTIQDPNLVSIYPNFGPKSGGSIVMISGEDIGVDNLSHLKVQIGDGDCEVVYSNDTQLRCETPSSSLYGFENVTVSIQGKTVESNSGLQFEYREDIVVANISPDRTILAGGIELTVNGTNFDSVALIESVIVLGNLSITHLKSFRSACDMITVNQLLCKTPFIDVPNLGSRSLQNGHKYKFIFALNFDGHHVIYPNFGLKGEIRMYNNPEINQYSSTVSYEANGNKPLTINGQNFMQVAEEKDYTITLSKYDCNISNFQNNRIQCIPPEKDPGISVLKLKLGNFEKTVGHVKYVYPKSHLMVALIVVGVILLVSIPVIVFVVIKIRKRRMDEVKKEQPFTPVEQNLYDILPPGIKTAINEHLLSNDLLQITESEENLLGKGYYGLVYKAFYNKKEVAVKTLKYSQEFNQVHEFVEEGIFMTTFNHKNILTLIGILFVKGSPYIVVPLMENGDLRSYVMKNTNLQFERKMNLIEQCCCGMMYMEENKVVHRDLAARNCLIDKFEKLKICDFGYARNIEEKDYYRQIHSRPKPLRWMAPESINNTYTSKSDVWSFGVLMWEVFSNGIKPYADIDMKDLERYLREGHRLPKLPGLRDNIYDVMSICWDIDPDARPDFKGLNEYFRENSADGYLAPIN